MGNVTKKYVLFTQEVHEGIDFSFTEHKVNRFIELWNQGYSIPDIAVKLGRKQIELTLLAMDLHMSGKIKAREGGFFGNQKVS